MRSRVVVGLLLTALATPSAAAGPLAAIAPGAAGKTPTLVGPSGERYEPDGATSWVRRSAGGASADVTGATTIDGDTVIAGRSTPLFQWRGDRWLPLRLGQRGRTIMGTGPVASVAVARHVFVWDGKRFIRVGAAPATVIALWASSIRRVYALTDKGLAELRRGTLAITTASKIPPVGFAMLVGEGPWLVADDAARNVKTGARLAVDTGGHVVAAASTGDRLHLLVTGADGTTRLVTSGGKDAGAALPLLDGARVAAMAVDTVAGKPRTIVATTTGEVYLFDGSTWTQGTLRDELPAAKTGAGPAQSATR